MFFKTSKWFENNLSIIFEIINTSWVYQLIETALRNIKINAGNFLRQISAYPSFTFNFQGENRLEVVLKDVNNISAKKSASSNVYIKG